MYLKLFFRGLEFDSSEFILGILVNSPQNFQAEEKPSTSETKKRNFMCTINRQKIASCVVCKSWWKWCYNKQGNAQKHLYYIKQVCQRAHYSKSEDQWYINKRATTSSTFRKIYVAKKDVYLVKRQYRYNKLNDFSQLIVEIKRMTEDDVLDYYYVLYRWLGDKQQRFSVRRHGNVQRPFLGKRNKFFFCSAK